MIKFNILSFAFGKQGYSAVQLFWISVSPQNWNRRSFDWYFYINFRPVFMLRILGLTLYVFWNE